ncbi:MAG: hypothetical protein AUH41_03950 [Gemmatimonadetes bacterium 13_1_40CM_66_11]|nr:MAG: hypothetical protein AUH41_03950 [Gemmatimonadetes bacterium 13_1_40CM_66_11]
MVLVCVSHFAGVYLVATGAPRQAVWLATIGMMATPTFIVVSGLLIGYLSDAYRLHLDSYRTKLRDRGLFLLIIGHLWLALTDSLRAGGVTMGLKRGYITDVIGVALLVMVPLARQTPWRMRIKAGLGLALLSSLAALAWHPAGKWMGTLEETLPGSSHCSAPGATVRRDASSSVRASALPGSPLSCGCWCSCYREAAAACWRRCISSRRHGRKSRRRLATCCSSAAWVW